MAGHGGRNKRQATNNTENRLVTTLDKLSAYEEFKAQLLPKIRAMLKDGKSSAELRAFAASYLTARQITIALTSDDEAAALRAIDAVTHQNEGKPKERIETEHRFGKLKENELDALIESRLQESSESDSTEH